MMANSRSEAVSRHSEPHYEFCASHVSSPKDVVFFQLSKCWHMCMYTHFKNYFASLTAPT